MATLSDTVPTGIYHTCASGFYEQKPRTDLSFSSNRKQGTLLHLKIDHNALITFGARINMSLTGRGPHSFWSVAHTVHVWRYCDMKLERLFWLAQQKHSWDSRTMTEHALLKVSTHWLQPYIQRRCSISAHAHICTRDTQTKWGPTQPMPKVLPEDCETGCRNVRQVPVNLLLASQLWTACNAAHQDFSAKPHANFEKCT